MSWEFFFVMQTYISSQFNFKTLIFTIINNEILCLDLVRLAWGLDCRI